MDISQDFIFRSLDTSFLFTEPCRDGTFVTEQSEIFEGIETLPLIDVYYIYVLL